MGIAIGILVFAFCLIYPAISILKSQSTAHLNKRKWAAMASIGPLGLIVVFALVERGIALYYPPAPADISSGWLSIVHGLWNLIALVMPWVVLTVYRDKQEALRKKSTAEVEAFTSE